MSRILFVLLLSSGAPLVAHAAGPCKSSCRELAYACKDGCGIRYGWGLTRHDCKKSCDAREHRCRAGCY